MGKDSYGFWSAIFGVIVIVIIFAVAPILCSLRSSNNNADVLPIDAGSAIYCCCDGGIVREAIELCPEECSP